VSSEAWTSLVWLWVGRKTVGGPVNRLRQVWILAWALGPGSGARIRGAQREGLDSMDGSRREGKRLGGWLWVLELAPLGGSSMHTVAR
jgi:hypothetical protein